MTLQTFTEVWTPLSVGTALVSGALVGLLVVGWFATNPLYSSGVASASRISWLTFGMAFFIALVFYSTQTLATYLVDDPAWPRVMSRFAVWIVFAAAIGLGTWIRMRIDRVRRHSKAHRRAVDELGR